MLDAHPELTIPPETHFINPFIQSSGRLRFNPRIAAHDHRPRRAPPLERLRPRGGGPARKAGAGQALQHDRRGARLLRALRRKARQAPLGRQDAGLHPQDEEAAEDAARGALHPRDPRRPRRRPVAERAHQEAGQGPGAAARDGAAVAQADRQGAGRRGRARALHRGPLRGHDHGHRGHPAPGLRAHRDRLRPGDARLLRARRASACRRWPGRWRRRRAVPSARRASASPLTP